MSISETWEKIKEEDEVEIERIDAGTEPWHIPVYVCIPFFISD